MVNLMKLVKMPSVAAAHSPSPISMRLTVGERTFTFASDTWSGQMLKVLGQAEGVGPSRPAEPADLRALLGRDPAAGSTHLLRWLRDPTARTGVTPQEMGARLTTLMQVAARPEGFLRKAAVALPSARRPALAAASLLEGLRRLGVDVRLPKSRATTEAIGQEITGFVDAFEDLTPMLFGQLNTAIAFMKQTSRQTPAVFLRDVFRSGMSAEGLAQRHGLTLSAAQKKKLEGWLDKKARLLATEMATFLKTRKPMEQPESLATFIDALMSDFVEAGLLPNGDSRGAQGRARVPTESTFTAPARSARR